MGVYIKDFEMPKDCDSCDIPNQIGCTLWIDTDAGYRHHDCPMREVPVPHGRLADCDAVEECLKEVTDGEMKDYAMMLLDWAVSKRTVIEREDE